MIAAHREAYKAQFEIAQKRVPRGHQISHVVWRDGQLTAISSPKPKPQEPDWVPRSRRGIAQERLI